jgi:hypothetical protein
MSHRSSNSNSNSNNKATMPQPELQFKNWGFKIEAIFDIKSSRTR